jgi:hypothetical protein
VAPGSRNDSRKTLRFQHLSCKRNESSVWSMRRGAVFHYGRVLWPLALELFPGKHCNISIYLAKRPRAQTFACTEVQFSDYGTVLWAPGSRKIPGKHCESSTYLAKRARAQSGACAEVQFPYYESELWSPGSRNYSRKALR